MLGLLIELESSQILLFVVLMNPNFGRLIELLLNFSKIVSRTIFITFLILFVFQIWTFSFKKNVPWVPFLLILLSNDIQLNPGPQPNLQNNCLNFINWNLNSLTKDNFQRVDLIEAHNSIFNYYLISVCETNLDDSVELPETLLKDFKFVPANHPLNIKHGGVGRFYKNSLPVNVRRDLLLYESIVVELKFVRKRIFLTLLYRSPSFDHASPEFRFFLSNFKNLFSKIKTENPFAMFFAGDFNGKSHL